MPPRIYIDGHAGTTGLRIREWLAPRRDIELLTLAEDERKDEGARRTLLRSADLAVLCLPEAAARDAVAWAEGAGTRIIDASTAHRVTEGWVYGLPELVPGQRQRISHATRVANPGCYASAFILLVRPLIDAGLLSADAPLTCHALSGYTGGGRQMIEKWEEPRAGLRSLVYEAPYALERIHKHVPEMIRYAGLQREPYFEPAVGPFRCGMRLQVPLHAGMLAPGSDGGRLWDALHERYRDEAFVTLTPLAQSLHSDERSFDPQSCNDTNRIALHVVPHPSGHVLLMAVLDNLGKGASGAAIQSLNLMLGIPETAGLPA
jgi:N-acetyl-gamma-glutamyl-phosphate reductase